MRKSIVAVACLVLISFLNAFAADPKTTSFASLPPEAQASIKAALKKDLPVQDFTLTASDGANDDQFGLSVAIDGNTIVVGAFQGGNQDLGAAYVFVKPASGWTNMTQIAELTPSDGEVHDCFGCSVSISGDTIVVGDSALEVNGNLGQGAAYVFVEPSTGWANMTETAELTASDGVSDARFGSGVAISGSTIVVGAPGTYPMEGEAYIFVEPDDGWVSTTQTAELLPSDGFAYDNFGISVSMSGDTALVGAPDRGSGSPEVGRGYIFVEPTGGWTNMTQTAELAASDGQIGNDFGWSVSIDGGTAVIGAPGHPDGGEVYVFVRPKRGWVRMTQTAGLQSGSGSSCTGWSASISGNVIVSGSQCDSGYKGAAFVFVRPPEGWRNSSKPSLRLSIPFTDGQDYFGASVAISGTTAVVGAPEAPTILPSVQYGPGEAFIFIAQ